MSGCAAPGAGPAAAGPQLGQPWSLPLAANVSADLAWIPPGSFTMGSPANESGRDRNGDEGPQTQVTLTKGFWLEKTFVTIGQWKSVTGRGVREQLLQGINDETIYDFGNTTTSNKKLLRDYMGWRKDVDPSTYLANDDDNLPMYYVSWNDAMEFCRQLTARERAAGRLPAGYAYTLPTEAQWEYACRAGTTTPTYAGPNSAAIVSSIAWYSGNAAQGYVGRAAPKSKFGPRPVAQKQPNAWGLYDMLGDINEWCRDWYGPYPGGSVTDPTGPASGTGHVNRGGSFGNSANDERSARRASNPPAEESAYRGFRLTLAPAP
jgi:formylglycine-generating enzyme required for sulfatase activity